MASVVCAFAGQAMEPWNLHFTHKVPTELQQSLTSSNTRYFKPPLLNSASGFIPGGKSILGSQKAEIMVHADASNFVDGVTKEEAYEQVLAQADALFYGQRNWVCNLANAASLLWHAYKSLGSPSKDVNWAGFYVLDKSSQKPQLILGPFQGKVACQTIAFGRGVCGAAAASQETQLVEDVDRFPGHIACDGDSRSEIVVPILVDEPDTGETKKLVGIIDIDCTVLSGFDEVDRRNLEELAGLIAKSCDW